MRKGNENTTMIDLPDDATLRRLELPARAGAGPSPFLREYAAVRNEIVRELTSGRAEQISAEELLPLLYDTPDRVRRQWAVERRGAIIGCATLTVIQDQDGRDAVANVVLRDGHRGRGIGTAVDATLAEEARAAGAQRILAWTEHPVPAEDRLVPPTGIGSIPRDGTARFALSRGYVLEQAERVSAYVWGPESVPSLLAHREEARRHADGYRIVQWIGPTPAEHVDGYAWLKSRMSTDAPDADLDLPEETWDAERVAEHDERIRESGFTIQVTAAQHVATGELCAFNELEIESDHHGTTHQQDTLVLADHRGHRLGMLVKAAGLLSWRQRFPHSDQVVTYNAEENRPMLSINEAIGFAPVATMGAWKKELT